MTRVLVGIPTTGTHKTVPMSCLLELQHGDDIKVEYAIISGSLVYDARNNICKIAVEDNYDFLLFVDDDIEFPPFALKTLLAREKDIISGLYFGRRKPYDPIIYKQIIPRSDDVIPETITEYNIDRELFKIDACGMGFCLINVDCIRKIVDDSDCSPFEPFKGLGEDISFCYRAKQSGFDIWCDTTFDLTHWGEYGFGKEDWLREKALNIK